MAHDLAASRAVTLQIFADLLAATPPVDIAAVDEAIWDYLAPVAGLHAQQDALACLSEGVAKLDTASPFMPLLRDTLDRHHARLSERQT
jgi:hypothetical protein